MLIGFIRNLPPCGVRHISYTFNTFEPDCLERKCTTFQIDDVEGCKAREKLCQVGRNPMHARNAQN